MYRSMLCRPAAVLTLLAWLAISFIAWSEPLAPGLVQVASRYSVQVVVLDRPLSLSTGFGPITAYGPLPSDVDSYAVLLEDEFGLYPPAFIRKTHLKRIVLCAQLSFNGQTRFAVPDFEHNTLYLRVDGGTSNEIYRRQVMHHEFFHIVDFHVGHMYQDEEWSALNPPDFKYGKGGNDYLELSVQARPRYNGAGFLSRYATASVEEDKAETFAFLMLFYQDVENWAVDDPIVEAKVDRLKEVLQNFSPDIDAAFWQRIRNSPLVWEGRTLRRLKPSPTVPPAARQIDPTDLPTEINVLNPQPDVKKP